jgi:hypothetical protein
MEIGEAVKQLNLLSLEMPRLVQNAARSALYSARAAATKDFVSKGVGRAIWGGGGKWKRNLAGARLIINSMKFRGAKEGPWDTGISVKGLAALVETGGKTREHLIKKRNGKALKTPIRHPGSRFQRDPFLERAVPVLNREYPSKLNRAIEKFKQKAGL